MAFKALFFVDGKQYTVKNYHYSGIQKTDNVNKPTGAPIHGHINLTLEASNDELLFHWFNEGEVAHDGKIVFFKDTDMASPMRTISFTKGYCILYEESYGDTGSDPMVINISITAGLVSINGIENKKNWA